MIGEGKAESRPWVSLAFALERTRSFRGWVFFHFLRTEALT